MFGLVRKSKYDALAERLEAVTRIASIWFQECERLRKKGVELDANLAMADAQCSQVVNLCCEGGVENPQSPCGCVKELLARVWVAAFNRGMLAEREVKRTSAA